MRADTVMPKHSQCLAIMRLHVVMILAATSLKSLVLNTLRTWQTPDH